MQKCDIPGSRAMPTTLWRCFGGEGRVEFLSANTCPFVRQKLWEESMHNPSTSPGLLHYSLGRVALRISPWTFSNRGSGLSWNNASKREEQGELGVGQHQEKTAVSYRRHFWWLLNISVGDVLLWKKGVAGLSPSRVANKLMLIFWHVVAA